MWPSSRSDSATNFLVMLGGATVRDEIYGVLGGLAIDYFYLLIFVAPYKFLWDVVVGVAFRGGGWKEGAGLERGYPGSPNPIARTLAST